MGIIITFLALLGVVCLYGCSVKAEFPTVMTEDIGKLVEKRNEALMQAGFFAELSGSAVDVDTTWSGINYESVLKA